MAIRIRRAIAGACAAAGLVAAAGCGGGDDGATSTASGPAPGTATSAQTPTAATAAPGVRIADPTGDTSAPDVDITGGTVARNGGDVVVTIRLASPALTGPDAPDVAYSAVIQNKKDSWLAAAQITGGDARYRLMPQDGAPGSDITGSVNGRDVTLVVPTASLGGDGPLGVSLYAQNGADDPSTDVAPDDGWPGPHRVNVP
ncbi:MAG: hypothetical protein KDC33_03240 [Thermoleophilia bacterium]|nr:hypothetical protein [Thermoleophilia bacterium]